MEEVDDGVEMAERDVDGGESDDDIDKLVFALLLLIALDVVVDEAATVGGGEFDIIISDPITSVGDNDLVVDSWWFSSLFKSESFISVEFFVSLAS